MCVCTGWKLAFRHPAPVITVLSRCWPQREQGHSAGTTPQHARTQRNATSLPPSPPAAAACLAARSAAPRGRHPRHPRQNGSARPHAGRPADRQLHPRLRGEVAPQHGNRHAHGGGAGAHHDVRAGAPARAALRHRAGQAGRQVRAQGRAAPAGEAAWGWGEVTLHSHTQHKAADGLAALPPSLDSSPLPGVASPNLPARPPLGSGTARTWPPWPGTRRGTWR